MQKKHLLLSCLLICFSMFSQEKKSNITFITNHFNKNERIDRKITHDTKHKKWVAASLNVTLGLFGVHRLYLGTSPKIPVIYTFTLGGGGFLMLSDLGVILFTKDLEQFSENPNVIMWAK